jgi:hypothetical protein
MRSFPLSQLDDLSAEEHMAVQYYRGLFKEFGLIDLKHYKSGKSGNAWLYCAIYIDTFHYHVRITKGKSEGNRSW